MCVLVHDVMLDVCTSLKTRCACMLLCAHLLKTFEDQMKTVLMKTAEDDACI
jgi:hypothetical protein